MTREEAKQWFVRVYSEIKGKGYTDENEEAYKMAIKALSQDPCDDAISRQYLLDNCVVDKATMPYVPVNKIKNAPTVTQKPIECDDAVSRDEVFEIICRETEWYDIRTQIEQLPSVTQKSGKWIDYSDDGFVECPFCGHATNCEDNIDELHYCFYCGARMVEPQESEG